MAIDRTLHQIGGIEAVRTRLELEQIRVEDLAGVIEAAAGARIEEAILAPLVRDLDPALLDVYVGRAVFAHAAELDDVALRRRALHRPDQLERGADIVAQGQPRLVVPAHRIGRRG